MAQRVEVLKTVEMRDGSMKAVKVGGHEILLAKVAGKFYAVDNRCPHMAAALSQGTLEGTIVTCPRHGSQFDVTSGDVIRWTDWSGIKLTVGKMLRSPRPLGTYTVTVEGDKVMVSTERLLAKAPA